MKNELYNSIAKKQKIKTKTFKNTIRAFFFGGLISLIAEAILWFAKGYLHFEKDLAIILMQFILITISSILTGLGIFDKIGSIAGAGTYLPLTGFANSTTSSALDAKKEGVSQGILLNMFKLSGAVIAFALIASVFVASIIYGVRRIWTFL